MNRNYATNLTPREIEAQYERLTLKDDFIFGKVMQEPCNCVEMLQRLTGNVIGSNISINNQKAIKVAVDGKGVRYDVYVEDESTGLYDAEMQQKENVVLPKHSRFYQGLMDLNHLETGRVSDDYTDGLEQAVLVARCNKEWRVEYMKTFIHDADVRREGKEIGIEIGISQGQDKKLISLICRKLRKGKSVDVIADELEEDISVVASICDIASSFAPEYDEEKISGKYFDEYIGD